MPECVSSSHTVGTRQRRQIVGVMTLMPNCKLPIAIVYMAQTYSVAAVH